MSRQMPEHVVEERKKALWWFGTSSGSVIALWAGLVAIGPAATWLWGVGLDRSAVLHLDAWLASLWPNPWQDIPWWYAKKGVGPWIWTTAAFGICALTAVLLHRANPYRATYMIHGDAKFAEASDVQAMDDGDQIGPSGKHLHLGSFDGRKIALIETLTVLAVAPPGTGKTARLIVPSILITDEASQIVHDPKPELWDLCSGWRSRIGPTFRLDWSRVDTPGKQGGWNPCFNFLDPRVIPPPGGGQRDTMVDSLAKILIPEKKGGGGDDYFLQRGRASLVGLMNFVIAKINDRQDEERFEGLPKRWHGYDASLPLMVDWLAESQLQSGEGDGGGDDPLAGYFKALVQECRDRDYPPRCQRELQPLILMADKERSGVLGSMDTGLLPFKNEAVVERTRESDFIPADMRGMLTDKALKRLGLEKRPARREEWEALKGKLEPGDWEPISIFVCINQTDAPAFENVTALFFELMSLTLLAYGPGETTPMGTLLGPYPVIFVMDEMVKMARCDAVMDGPDLGRSKKCSYIFVAQSSAQFERRYSKEQKQTIVSTAAVKYLLAQNDAETIQEMAKLVGETTVRRRTISRQVGLSKQSNPLAGNQSEQLDKVSLINTRTLAQMKKGTHMLIVQNFLPRPVVVQSPLYFLDEKLARRAYNPRIPPEANAYPPSDPLPDWMGESKEERHMLVSEQDRVEKEKDRIRYWMDPEHMADTPARSP